MGSTIPGTTIRWGHNTGDHRTGDHSHRPRGGGTLRSTTIGDRVKPRVTGDFAVPTNVNKYIHIHMFKGPKRTDPFRNTSATRGNNNDRITNGQTDGRLVENECWQGRRFGQDTVAEGATRRGTHGANGIWAKHDMVTDRT